MRQWIRSFVFSLVGLCAWAEAGAVRLSDLDRLDLAELTVGLPELRQSKRRSRLADSKPVAEVLVKFHEVEQVRALSIHTDDPLQVVERLKTRGDIAFAEPNARLQRQLVPSDPLFALQWHHEMICSTNAWDWGTGSSSVKIAIVDAPFNLNHPDLSANAANGWDVVNEVPVYSGSDSHATMSAGMAAGVLGNETGIAGAGNCTLVPVNNAYADLTTDIAQLDAAIRWAADHGIRVVNLSWDGAYSDTLNLAAQYLRDTVDGIVVMAGVNGSGLLNYTNHPYIVAVSMTDSDDTLQSHYGPHIDFAAPGKSIYSTTTQGYGTDSGTSYAAPLVSGVLATLFAINPMLSAEDALSILKATAVDLGTPGWDPHFGWGRIDFYQAAWLAAAVMGSVPNLGPQYLEMAEFILAVSTEFHPGIAYSLQGTTNLDPAVWSQVPAVMQINGTYIEFSVEPEADAAFYRIIGEPDFQ